jgi:hypothetical protein
MIHYHGTPITPLTELYSVAGRHFCVSHAHPQQVRQVHDVGQSVLLDNGAFSAWKVGRPTDWPGYYAWCDQWLDFPTTWAVIPDVIDAGTQEQDALLREWPHGDRGAPVWHMDEPIDRILRLCDDWPRVCIGSTAEFRVVLSPSWTRRVEAVFDALALRHRRTPWLHMLRGMQLSGGPYPFASVDSTDVARNHNRRQNTAKSMVERWDAVQCPAKWAPRPQQMELIA